MKMSLMLILSVFQINAFAGGPIEIRVDGFTCTVRSNTGPQSNQKDFLTEDLSGEVKRGEVKIPEGCVLKNAFRYIESVSKQKSNLSIQMEPEAMENLIHFLHDRLVLDHHEIFYRIARVRIDDHRSRRVRLLLAYALSDQVQVKGSAQEAKFNSLRDDFWENARLQLTCPQAPVEPPKMSSLDHPCNQKFESYTGTIRLIPTDDGNFVHAYLEKDGKFYAMDGTCDLQTDGSYRVQYRSLEWDAVGCGYQMSGIMKKHSKNYSQIQTEFEGTLEKREFQIGENDGKSVSEKGLWISKGRSEEK